MVGKLFYLNAVNVLKVVTFDPKCVFYSCYFHTFAWCSTDIRVTFFPPSTASSHVTVYVYVHALQLGIWQPFTWWNELRRIQQNKVMSSPFCFALSSCWNISKYLTTSPRVLDSGKEIRGNQRILLCSGLLL
jgi:hypothetical protein